MVYDRLLNTLFAETCPRCGQASEAGYCHGCRAEFSRVGPACRRCGLRQPVLVCPRSRMTWRVEAVVAPFDYDVALKRQLVALKFHGARAAGRALGLLLAEAAAAHRADVDALVAVPLHAPKLRRRGYNQSAEIARSAGRRLELPVLGAGLRRLRGGPPQIELRAEARRTHPRGAFAAARGVAGLRIAVVDDVITTGATVNACADALLDAGACAVQAWAVARTAE